MNNKFTLEDLTKWVGFVKDAAKEDQDLSIIWFDATKDSPFSIIAGWQEGFSESQADLFCLSKANPKYAMCVKVAINDGPYTWTDFELMEMPSDEEGLIDDNCIPLEWDDDPEYVAQFFMNEWERIMEEHSKEEL